MNIGKTFTMAVMFITGMYHFAGALDYRHINGTTNPSRWGTCPYVEPKLKEITPGKDYDITAPGHICYDNPQDNFWLLGDRITGDFDVKVQITQNFPPTQADYTAAGQPACAKGEVRNGVDNGLNFGKAGALAGIMAREDTTGTARFIWVTAQANTGSSIEEGYRVKEGAYEANGFDGFVFSYSAHKRPDFPGCWLRMRRAGTVFTLYVSSDGTLWGNPIRTANINYKSTLYVGIFKIAHSRWTGTLASFRNLNGLSSGVTSMRQQQPVSLLLRSAGSGHCETYSLNGIRIDGAVVVPGSVRTPQKTQTGLRFDGAHLVKIAVGK
jgi:hypothetical protein